MEIFSRFVCDDTHAQVVEGLRRASCAGVVSANGATETTTLLTNSKGDHAMNGQSASSKTKLACYLVMALTWIQLATAPARAQTEFVASETHLARPRIMQAIDDSVIVRMPGSRPRVLDHSTDLGRMDGDTELGPLFLVLKSSPEQEHVLQTLLMQQQDKGSPNYHRWLTPDEFGAVFGVEESDLQRITDWLIGHGFTVKDVARGRRLVGFTGTVAKLEESFGTEMHNYLVGGERHFSNSTEISIPAAFGSVVAGLASLNDFKPQPHRLASDRIPTRDAKRASTLPDYAGSTGNYLSPGDFAVIYNTEPLLEAGYDGTGVKIGIIGRSDINISDVKTFRGIFLPPQYAGNSPLQIPADTDPGETGDGNELEADLDVEWAGAVAPGAQIILVTSTDQTILTQAKYLVEETPADIISVSLSQCESSLSTSFSTIWEQAATQGITVFVSTGDSGSANCDDPNKYSISQQGYAVNGMASTLYNVAVGGTEFDESDGTSSYWTSGNSKTPAGLTYTSALKYIPEMVWNESSANGGKGIWAGGGGVSTLYPTPPWQAGIGLPPTGLIPPYPSGFQANPRYLPDVSLSAAGHDGYLVCTETDPLLGNCWTGGPASADVVDGTSAATPSFAGIQALIDQQYGRQGQADYVYYRLAATEQNLSACNSLRPGGPDPSCIFNDITLGYNGVPCQISPQDPFCTTGVLPNYVATAGYDLATGLGSVNASNLFQRWESVSFATTTTLTASAYNIAQSSNTALTATVAGGRSPSSPLGSVSFNLGSQTGPVLGTGALSVNGGGTETVTLTIQGSQLQVGNNNVYAVYSGDGTDDAPSSAMVTIVVSANTNKSTTTTALSASATQVTQGTPVTFTAKVQSGNGTPTGSVTFYDGTAQLGKSTLDNTATSVLSTSSLGSGTHSISGSYGGDQNFSASTSSSIVVTVNAIQPVIAVNPSTGTLGVTQFQKSGSGFTPNGAITQRVTYPDGEVDTVTRVVDVSGSYSYTITYANQLGKYVQTDTDNQTGRPSNTTSWTVTAAIINDFSLQPTPSSQLVSQSSSAGFDIETATTTGSPQSVTFSAANVPTGLTASFSPTSVTSGSGSALTVTASSTAPTGTFTLTITGSGSSATHTTQVSVTVVQAASGPIVKLESTVVRFNSQPVGSISTPETVMLMNSGSGQLMIDSIALAAGSDYILTFPSPIPSILNSLVPFSFQVAFEPSQTGLRSGQILIYDNAPGSPQIVTLSGTGTAAQPTTGTINVNATLNGTALPSSYNYSYSLTGPASYTGGGAYSFSVTPGTYTVAFSGSPSYLTLSSVTPSNPQTVSAGGNVTFTLNFTAPNDFCPPSFMLPAGGGVTPQIVKAGGNATYTVDVCYPTGNAASPITLSVLGTPQNSIPTFSPQPSYGSSTLTVSTGASSTPSGVYSLSLSGTNSSGLTHAGNTSSLAVTTPPAQPVQLVSVSTAGAQANGASTVSLGAASADGRYFVFSTAGTNLVSGNTSPYGGVYVRDRQTGTTTPVSVSSSGVLSDYGAGNASISADDRFAIFTSTADNLYPGSVLGTQGIYVRDLVQGITEREDIASNGTPGNADAFEPNISADGRFVKFLSNATNLVSGVTGTTQVYVRDRTTGKTTLVSVAPDGTPANASASGAAISADGRFVAFDSFATNLVSQNTNGLKQAFLRDVSNGTTVLVSAAGDGTPANLQVYDEFSGTYGPLAISADGRFVVFNSMATNLVSQPTDGTIMHVFLRDAQMQHTTLIDVDSVGVPLGGWSGFNYPGISADGRFVSFRGFLQVLIRDTVANQTSVVSLASDGSAGNETVVAAPADTDVSPGGTAVVFASGATNLVSNDTNGVADAFAAQNPFLGSSYLQSLALSSSSIPSGSAVTGTITLSSPAPAGGATVAVWTNNAAAQVAGTIVVPAGATSAPVSISTSLVPAETVLTVLASYNGGSAVAILTLEPTPELSVSPQTWAFGNQAVGSTSAATIFSVSNPGTAPLTNVSVTLVSGQLFHIGDNSCGTTLPAGSDCSVSLTFSPSAAGQQSDSVQIVYGSPANTQLVGLTGYGTMPSASVAPSSLNFGNQSMQTTTLKTETLANTGAGPLANISAAITGTNAGDFSISTDNCSGTTLPSNSNCSIAVAFSPAGSGLRSAVLNIASNAPQTPQQVALTGIGTQPSIAISSVSPGSVTLVQAGSPQSVTVSLTLSNYAGSITLVTSTLPSGVTATYTQPGTGNSGSITLQAASNAALVSNQTITITASGSGVSSATSSFSLTVNAGQGISVSPANLDFANQGVGTTSAAQIVTLANTGTVTLTISSITPSGDFSQTNTCGTTVNAGANCTISVTFKPTAAGMRTGTLSISDNAAGSPQSVALSGTGQDFSFSPPSGSSTSATVAPGSPATYTLSVGGEGGFSGMVTFTCTGAPSEATCTASPNPVTVGGSATNVTVTVTTTAASANAQRSRPLPPIPPLSPNLRGLVMLALALAAMGWAIGRRSRPRVSRWQSQMVPLTLGLLLTLALAGCGGGGGGGGGGGTMSNPGTPAGTYTLTVTGTTGSGSSAVSHGVVLTLTVS